MSCMKNRKKKRGTKNRNRYMLLAVLICLIIPRITGNAEDAEDPFQDAALLAITIDREAGKVVGYSGCIAVTYNDLTWLISDDEYENMDYDEYSIVLSNLNDDEEWPYALAVSLNDDLCTFWSSDPYKGAASFPLGEYREGSSLYVCISCVKDGELSMMSGYLDAEVYESENGYVVDQDMQMGRLWNGAAILDADEGTLAGIGVYRDGKYLFQEIDRALLNPVDALENWGKDEDSGAAPSEEPGGTEKEKGGSGDEPVGNGEDDRKSGDAPEEEKGSPLLKNLENYLSEDKLLVLAVAVIAVLALGWQKHSKNKNGKPDGKAEFNAAGQAPQNPASQNPTPVAGTILLGPEQRQSQYILQGIAGPAQGQQLVLQDRIAIGRDPQYSDLKLPEGTAGISRRHCEVMLRGGQIILKDVGSSYGTFLESGVKLNPQTEYRLEPGTVFYLANRRIAFKVTKI